MKIETYFLISIYEIDFCSHSDWVDSTKLAKKQMAILLQMTISYVLHFMILIYYYKP